MTTYLVTGANRGIGLEICRQLAAAGHDVIAACRKASAELSKLGESDRVRVEVGVDLASDESVAGLAGRLGDTHVDVLVQNAGILEHTSLEDGILDSVRRQFEVNAVGPLRLVLALSPKMKKGSKIVLITSRMGSIADNTSGGSYGYRMSKVALNMAAVSMSHDLKAKGIAVAVVHPGFVKTEMTGGMGNVTADVSAGQIIDRIAALDMERSGSFWHANGDSLPW